MPSLCDDAIARRVPRHAGGCYERASGSRLTAMITETQQVVTPDGPDDEATHEPGGEGGQEDGDDRAEIQRSRGDGGVRAPAEADHADSRRQSISPSSTAKAAIGNITNAAVKSVTLSRMVYGSSVPSFRKGCAGPGGRGFARGIQLVAIGARSAAPGSW